jgi:hypothetical protein
MKIYLYLILCLFIYNISNAQNRIGIYAMATNTALQNNSVEYSKDVFNSISSQNNRRPFHGNLYFTYPMWNYKNYGLWVLVKQKKKFSFYGTIGKTTLGHKTFYEGGKSEDYPYPVLKQLQPGQQLTIQNTVTLHLLSVGIKTEYRVNRNFNIELNVNYGFTPKQNSTTFRTVFATTFSSPTDRQGGSELYYTDVNPDGIINGMGGINCNLSNHFKLHLLYLKTINGVNKFKEFMPFRYRQQYQGIAIQLSYNFFNPNKNDD